MNTNPDDIHSSPPADARPDGGDALSGEENHSSQCACHENAVSLEALRFLGVDATGSDISLKKCPQCGQIWLMLFHIEDGFSGSGLWYLLPLSDADAHLVTTEDTRAHFEAAPGYWAGGSYFNSTGFKRSGRLIIAPYIGIM